MTQKPSVVSLIGNLVERFELHRDAYGAPHERQTLEREIDAADKQLDGVVYELYGLTPDETVVVENAT